MNEKSWNRDFSLLDRPEVLELIFYPRREWTPPPPGASDFLVPTEDGVHISCRFYPTSHVSPCILFFHGNGEVACDYDGVAPIYNEIDISLFVADYRGYGRSDGKPGFSSMLADAHHIFDFFLRTLEATKHGGPIFIMGRSLGVHSTIELALHYSKGIKGVIVESGAARMARLLSLFNPSLAPEQVEKFETTLLSRIRSLTTPVLILHGERDSLIPSGEAVWFYKMVGSKVKQLVLIPEAEHNDIMLVGIDKYFSAIKEFLIQ